MALNKNYIGDNGVSTTYHRVHFVSLAQGTLNCVVNSYVSKNYREQEKVALTSHFSFKATTEEEESMGIRALCYKKIKELPEWSDATDC